MNALVQKFSDVVKGVLNGFDRIVFKGSILPLMHDKGVMDFCRARGILNKEYKDWMQTQTAKVVDAAQSRAKENCGEGIARIQSSRVRKEEIARLRQQELHVESGLIGVWSATESCRSYKARYCGQADFPQLRGEWTKCNTSISTSTMKTSSS